jgi:hypothetical protein
MSGQEAYERKPRERTWEELDDEEKARWNKGAALPAVVGVIDIAQAGDAKAR